MIGALAPEPLKLVDVAHGSPAVLREGVVARRAAAQVEGLVVDGGSAVSSEPPFKIAPPFGMSFESRTSRTSSSWHTSAFASMSRATLDPRTFRNCIVFNAVCGS